MDLVIGYGNELRRDDGVGPRIARTVAAWNLPGVRCVAVHQLTPDLAEAVAGADQVFFVDAASDNYGKMRVRPVSAGTGRASLGHTSSPRELLALAEAFYDGRPQAWLVAVPTEDLGFGEVLSPVASEGMEAALRWLRRHLVPEDRLNQQAE